MIIVGLDLHKSYSYLTVMDGKGQVMDEVSLPSQAEDILHYLRNFENSEVVFEATRNWYWLYEALQREGIKVTMAHPKKTKAITEAKIATDRISSKMLANLKRANLIPQAYLAPLWVRELREVLRHRVFLVRERAKLKSKIRSLLAKLNLDCSYRDILGKGAVTWLKTKEKALPEVFQFELRSYLRLGKDLTEEIKQVETRIKKQVKEDDIVDILITIPGVGEFTALVIRAEVGTIDRFPTPDKLSSYCGLVPSVHSSGNHTRRGKITKEGNTWLRWVLVEASWKVKNGSKHFRNVYDRIVKKKGKNVAKVACARKLAVAIWHMWTRGEPFKEPVIHG